MPGDKISTIATQGLEGWRDGSEVCTSLGEVRGVATALEGRKVVVYLDEVFWGVCNMTERHRRDVAYSSKAILQNPDVSRRAGSIGTR